MDTIILTLFVCAVVISYFGIMTIYIKFDKIPNSKKITGLDVARKILDKNKLKHIIIIETKNKLGDGFDLDRGILKLSSNVFHNDSISSLGIASFLAYQFIWEYQNKESYLLKSKVDNLLKYIIGGSYIMLLAGLMINDNAFINISISILLVIMLYHICILSYKLNLYNYVKEQNEKSLKKDSYVNLIYTMMIFIDFKIYVTLIIEAVKQLIEWLKTKK